MLRRTERSDDERRLLGDYEYVIYKHKGCPLLTVARQDVDAVPISVPRNPPSHDKMTPGGVGDKPPDTENFGTNVALGLPRRSATNQYTE